MYRSYPEFTAKRLAMAKSPPKSLTESYTDTCRRAPSADDPLTNWRYLLNEEPGKGPYETVMFWFLGSDSEQHEPLSDTIERRVPTPLNSFSTSELNQPSPSSRLMTFIRKGEPYPYNLDRPPPRRQYPTSTDMGFQEARAISPSNASSATLVQQGSSSQLPTNATNGTVSDLDKLFSKLLPSASLALTPNNGKVTMKTLFASASASASSTPTSNLVNQPPTATTKGLTLLDSIFASATPPPGFPAPTPPPLHHVSSEPFPPPPSAPPSTRLAFAQAHQHSEISSSEPESSEDTSPTYLAAAQLIHSPQPTTSQLPQILTQDVISALLGMPPSRTSSVASSQRRYEGDVESSDDPHEADSPIGERPKPQANRAMKHELGDVTPRPPLRGFASSEKVLATPPAPLPSQHSAPSVLPTVAVSVPPCVPPPSEPAPVVAAASPAPAPAAPAPAVPGPRIGTSPAPRIGTSPAPRALVPFHAESTLWPYPRVPLDDRDDIVELDFADTSALSDVDAFERRRLNGRNGAKHSKKDRAREREEIERSWDVPGKSITPNLDPGSLHAPEIFGRPSQSQAHLAVVGGARGSAAASPSPQAQPGAGSSVKPSQPNNSASALAKNPEPLLSSTGGPPAPPPSSSNNKSKSKAKSAPNGPNGKASTPVTAQVQTTGAVTLVKSAASAAIVEAAHAHPNGNGSLATRDRNEFVREVLALINVRPLFPSFSSVGVFHSFSVVRLDRLMPRSWIGFGRSIVRGRSVADLVSLVF